MLIDPCDTWPASDAATPHLFGLQGELVDLRIPVEPRLLEDLLEALASLDFPVNPQLFHQPGVVLVEFPAYANHLTAVRKRLSDVGFDPDSVEVYGILRYQAAAHG
jgi:hypothetical protein